MNLQYMEKQIIKIFDKEIGSAMSFDEILKICKSIENTTTKGREDVEEAVFTAIRIDENKENDKDPYICYEIIFNEGKLESVEHWRVQIIFSTVSKEKIRNIQS